MVKSAGFLKKLKKIGNVIGKGATWVNKNILKPLNPILDTALDFVPGGGIIKGVKNGISKGLDFVDDAFYNTKENKQIQNIVSTGADVLLDTQRAPRDRKYIRYDDYVDSAYGREDDDDYAPPVQPQRKIYSNPFGQRLN